MSMIQGIPVRLAVRTQTGVDSLNNPSFKEDWITVENVLVGQPTSEEILDALSLYGKRIQFVLGIPKGDTHAWEDTEVVFFGLHFRTVGNVLEGIEANVPGPWHKTVRVERCD